MNIEELIQDIATNLERIAISLERLNDQVDDELQGQGYMPPE